MDVVFLNTPIKPNFSIIKKLSDYTSENALLLEYPILKPNSSVLVFLFRTPGFLAIFTAFVGLVQSGANQDTDRFVSIVRKYADSNSQYLGFSRTDIRNFNQNSVLSTDYEGKLSVKVADLYELLHETGVFERFINYPVSDDFLAKLQTLVTE